MTKIIDVVAELKTLIQPLGDSTQAEAVKFAIKVFEEFIPSDNTQLIDKLTAANERAEKAEAELKNLMESAEWWRGEYSGLTADKLETLAVMRAACRKLDMAMCERLEADLKAAREALTKTHRMMERYMPNEGAWEIRCPFCYQETAAGKATHKDDCAFQFLSCAIDAARQSQEGAPKP